MKITCAISPKQIENLYKHAYAKMYKALQQNESFDAEAYMRDLFNAISKSKDDATAAKFLQQVPSVLGTLSMNSKFLNLDMDPSALRGLMKKFKNEETGIVDTIIYFKPETPQETLDFLIKEKQNQAFLLQQNESDPEVSSRPRLKPYSSYTSTFQEFAALDPKHIKEFTIEVIDQSKKRIYKALAGIREENGNSNTLLDDMVYQGRILKLKAVPRIARDSNTNTL